MIDYIRPMFRGYLYGFQTQEIPKGLAGVHIGEFDLHGNVFNRLIEHLEMKVAADAYEKCVILHQLDALNVLLLQEILRRLLYLVLLGDFNEAQTIRGSEGILLRKMVLGKFACHKVVECAILLIEYVKLEEAQSVEAAQTE